ncbi:MAG: adenosine deaminase [Spirochaetales bacterium]|nr:adenosine deaminase [Spirochaetales bacterium]
MNVKDSIIAELRDVPKTEIHLHIEAVTTANTVWKLIHKHNTKLENIGSIEDLESKFNVTSLTDFIDLFINIVQKSFKEAGDFDLLMDDLRSYLNSNGIVYTEVYLAPTTFIKNGIDFSEIVSVLNKHADLIYKEDNIDIKFIIDVSRGFGLDNAMKNLDLTIANRTPRIIGIGLGGAEKVGKAEIFAPVFEKAIKEGFRVVAHAGEDDDYTSINSAINNLKVERIGHGISAMENEECMDSLKKLQIPLEICPTSNLFTQTYVKKIEDHPVKKFYNRGIFVTINSDDPTLFGTTLLAEYALLIQNKIFTKKEIGQLIINNLRATFMDQDLKDSLEIKMRESLNNKGYL